MNPRPLRGLRGRRHPRVVGVPKVLAEQIRTEGERIGYLKARGLPFWRRLKVALKLLLQLR